MEREREPEGVRYNWRAPVPDFRIHFNSNIQRFILFFPYYFIVIIMIIAVVAVADSAASITTTAVAVVVAAAHCSWIAFLNF